MNSDDMMQLTAVEGVLDLWGHGKHHRSWLTCNSYHVTQSVYYTLAFICVCGIDSCASAIGSSSDTSRHHKICH